MNKLGITNDDIQEIFNDGVSEGLTRRFIDKNGFRTGILFHYDGYNLRYVIENVYRRALKSDYAKKVEARNLNK